MEKTDILTVGDSTVDNIFEIDDDGASIACSSRDQEEVLCFKYGEKIPIKKIHRELGGSALNTAIGFSKLGLSTSISSIVGNDNDGQDIIDFLKNSNIESMYIKKGDSTNMSTILIYKHERTILSYHCKRDYEKLELPNASNIYFCSAGKGSEKILSKILERISTGSILYFNPGSWELQNFDYFASLVKHCRVFILNRSEAEMCIKGKSINEKLSEMLKLGTDIAVITDSAKGAFVADTGGKYHMEAYTSNVIDPTGAGDSFSAGFISCLILGYSLEESCKWGMLNSASTLEYYGANRGLLNRDQIMKDSSGAKGLVLKKIKE